MTEPLVPQSTPPTQAEIDAAPRMFGVMLDA